ncbi:MAG: sugar phosphate isomerase/epimerase [Armatimonadetes bacterium]|nr:sugar phosphate isomerase/epimerase [Armatimonadota bacterium]MDW8121145.1 sugar phosphate isomerase/epimerase family protein [Armatimonadota bacterium]
MERPNLGFAVSYLDPERLQEQLTEWSSAGFGAIETDYPPLLENPIRVLESWSSVIRDAGITVWSVHAPYGGAYNLSHPDKRQRRRAVEIHKVVLERSHILGAQVLVIHPSADSSHKSSAPSLLNESLEELLPLAQDLKIVLAVENMLPDSWGENPAELSRLIAGFLSPWIRLCFDTGHAHIAGNATLWLETVLESVATYHLADNEGTHDLHLQPGYGTVPWHQLAPLLQEASFPLIIEAIPWGKRPLKRVREEVEALLTGRVATTAIAGTQGYIKCRSCGSLLIEAEPGAFSCSCL